MRRGIDIVPFTTIIRIRTSNNNLRPCLVEENGPELNAHQLPIYIRTSMLHELGPGVWCRYGPKCRTYLIFISSTWGHAKIFVMLSIYSQIFSNKWRLKGALRNLMHNIWVLCIVHDKLALQNIPLLREFPTAYAEHGLHIFIRASSVRRYVLYTFRVHVR